jgi:hypothetical protein
VGTKWLTQENLVLVLALLLGLKFALLPLLEWQADRLDELAAKSRQLAKVDLVIENEKSYSEKLKELRAYLDKNSDYIYRDSDSSKLSIQRDLEEIFIQGGLTVTGFSWVLDSRESADSVRVLRGTVYFLGATTDMVKVFWHMASSSRLIRIVDWRQQIQRYGPDIFGMTSGNVTLELFASDEYFRAGDEAAIAGE